MPNTKEDFKYIREAIEGGERQVDNFLKFLVIAAGVVIWAVALTLI